jgi:hypothetical protein
MLVALFTVFASTIWAPSPIRAMQPTDEVATKIAELLDQSGYAYTKHSDTTWSIKRQGINLSQFKVVVAAGPHIMVTFVTVVEKAQMNGSEDMLRMLLRQDHEYDYAKVGLDADDDLFVRIDSDPRLLDLRSFKGTIEQVANTADEVYKKVRPFLNTP